MSFLFALCMIVAMALLHSDGMSSMFRESSRCSIFTACEMCGVSDGAVGGSFSKLVLVCCWRLASFLSLVRRYICLLSDFGIGGRRFCCSVVVGGCVMDQIVCACLWYVCIMSMTCLVALSIWVVGRSWETVISARKSEAGFRASWVCWSPSW